MEFEQRHPIPMPETGAFSSVRATIETVFDWQYELKRTNLVSLYEKGKNLAWNASDVDWSIDVDLEKLLQQRVDNGVAELTNKLLQPPVNLSNEDSMRLQLNINAFLLSQFLHGEQGALVSTAKIVQNIPWEEAKFYAANQVSDEARHVEVYHRYLTEKMGVSYEVTPSLGELLDKIVLDPRWDITFLGMQIMVEGLALAAFALLRMQMADEPLIQDIVTRVIGDESRHVAFGVVSLDDYYRTEITPNEMRDREDFVIEATELLYQRLLLTPVFERLGWDAEVWSQWSQETAFMRGFRQMTFAKIVPNLKRLGLLTPRVREFYADLDLLKYETLKDSVEEPEAQPPHEMVELLNQLMQNAPTPQASEA